MLFATRCPLGVNWPSALRCWVTQMCWGFRSQGRRIATKLTSYHLLEFGLFPVLPKSIISITQGLTRAYSSSNSVKRSTFCFVPQYDLLLSGCTSFLVLNLGFAPAQHIVPSRVQVTVVTVVIVVIGVDRAADLELDHLNGGWYLYRYWILIRVTLRMSTA